MFFLNGDIFPKLRPHIKMLRSAPKNMIKTWAQNTAHAVAFINALIRRQIYNKQRLLDVWKKDQFCKWFYHISLLDIRIFSFIPSFLSFYRSRTGIPRLFGGVSIWSGNPMATTWLGYSFIQNVFVFRWSLFLLNQDNHIIKVKILFAIEKILWNND